MMGPNTFQSSFIPKGAGGVIGQTFKKKKSSFFGIIISFIFVITLLITIGIFGYKWLTAKSIESLKTELTVAEQDIDVETIDTMVSFSKKLSAARDVVMRHRVVSNFLATLSDNTVQSIAYDDFSYRIEPNGQLSVNLKGKASDYGSIALQDSILVDLGPVKSLQFSDMSLVEGGMISFSLRVSLDPSSAIYAPGELTAPAVETEVEEATIAEDLDNL